VWSTPDRERARKALDALPEPQRVLVELAYFEGLTCSEMASHCAIPIGTVKSRLSAAMSKLREAFASGGIDA
jgi:RNA polymerase sigma-70 factor (ECF subfamily)